jgi:iron-sulfur cluster assembly accessory protein
MTNDEHEHDEKQLSTTSMQDAPNDSTGLTLELSEVGIQAAKQFQQENAAWQGMPLRVYLSGKGCDGFEYGVCFDQQDPGDRVFEFGNVTLVCDPETFKFIAGSTVNFVDDERGRGFVVENPRHKQFRGKFYKRKGWEERLKI